MVIVVSIFFGQFLWEMIFLFKSSEVFPSNMLRFALSHSVYRCSGWRVGIAVRYKLILGFSFAMSVSIMTFSQLGGVKRVRLMRV